MYICRVTFGYLEKFFLKKCTLSLGKLDFQRGIILYFTYQKTKNFIFQIYVLMNFVIESIFSESASDSFSSKSFSNNFLSSTNIKRRTIQVLLLMTFENLFQGIHAVVALKNLT